MKVMMSCADQPTLCKLDCFFENSIAPWEAGYFSSRGVSSPTRNLPKYLRTGDVDLSVFVS